MSFLSGAPQLGVPSSKKNSNSLSLSGAPSLAPRRANIQTDGHDGGDSEADLFEQILAGERKESQKKKKKKKRKKKSSKAIDSDSRESRERRSNRQEKPPESRAGATKSGEAAVRSDDSFASSSFGGGYVPSALSGPTSRMNGRDASVADRALASIGDLDSQLFGLSGNSMGGKRNSSGAASTSNPPKQKAENTNLSFGDSWDDDIDDLLDEGKPVASNTRNNTNTKSSAPKKEDKDEQSRMRAELGLEESGDYLMESFASNDNAGALQTDSSAVGYQPSGMTGRRNDPSPGDDDEDDIDMGGYKPWEKASVNVESSKHTSSSKASPLRSKRSPSALLGSSTKSSSESRTELPSARARPLDDQSAHNGRGGPKENNIFSATNSPPDTTKILGSDEIRPRAREAASDLGAVRTLKRQIESLEANANSMKRRAEHERRAREAEFESKLSLQAAAAASDKRDLKLALERQEDAVLRLKRANTDLQQQLTERLAKFQRERDESSKSNREQLERLVKLHESQVSSLRSEFQSKSEAAEAIHAREVASIEKRMEHAENMAKLAAQVNDCTAGVDTLRKKVEAESDASQAARLAQVEARERMVAEMENNVREMRARSDAEYKRLKSMMATLEVTQSRFGAGQEEDRVRLREEHARLEAMQVSLETERNLVRQDIAKERDALRADRASFETERRDWREQSAKEKAELDDRKAMLESKEKMQRDFESKLRRQDEDLQRRTRTFEEQRSSILEELKEEVTVSREKNAELERIRLELNMERTAMDTDKKNMEKDMKK